MLNVRESLPHFDQSNQSVVSFPDPQLAPKQKVKKQRTFLYTKEVIDTELDFFNMEIK